MPGAEREAQQIQGGPVGPEFGARIDAAAVVLQSRGIIQECYSFQSIDSVVNALLERGPVVASMLWDGARMSDPLDVEGWIVGRPRQDMSASGGSSCVLLNGVTLDLTIDGVTGFVRLKNCWGRQWGDDGQILVSIADLAATMQLNYACSRFQRLQYSGRAFARTWRPTDRNTARVRSGSSNRRSQVTLQRGGTLSAPRPTRRRSPAASSTQRRRRR